MNKLLLQSFKFRVLIFSFSIIFLYNISLHSQTWVSTNYWDPSVGMTVNYVPHEVGPLEMCKTTGGQIHSIVRIDPDETNYFINIPINGVITGGTQISHSGGIYSESAGNLSATSDSGSVYITQHIGSRNATIKLFKSGSRGFWTKTHTASPYPNYISPSVFGKCFILYNDSLVEVDGIGNYLRSKKPFSGRIHALNDSDFIVFRGSIITREDFNGNVQWTRNISNKASVSVDTNFIYGRAIGTVFKLRTSDGSLIWEKNIPFSSISITHDGGLISCGGIQPDQITRYDSSGNVIWTRHIPFSEFGYKSIIEARPNYYITGGGYLCRSVYSTGNGYSYFLLSLDSTGHGMVDSTDHFYYGNANDNNILSFADDGAYIAAAVGNSGSPRPAIFNRSNSSSVFLQNWPGRFMAGYNYKFSDWDGNGLIDTNDIVKLSMNTSIMHRVDPHWRVSGVQNSLPLLKILFSKDTVLVGDSVDIYITAGYDSIVVDSIYSISMTLLDPWNFYPPSGILDIPTNNFGTKGVNLYYYFLAGSQYNHFLMSRTDHINAVLSQDTLVSFRLHTKNTALEGKGSPFILYNAVTVNGYKVDFRIESDSIYISNPVTSIINSKDARFNVHPNPASDFINIALPESIRKLTVYNSVGLEIFSKELVDAQYSLNTSGFSDGFYFLQCTTTNSTFISKILIMH